MPSCSAAARAVASAASTVAAVNVRWPHLAAGSRLGFAVEVAEILASTEEVA